MPRLCAFGCKRTGVTVHYFPNPKKFPDRFKTWVGLCGGKLESASDYDYYKKQIVCDIHFKDTDRNRFKRLNALAVPSLHLPGTSASVESSIRNLTLTSETVDGNRQGNIQLMTSQHLLLTGTSASVESSNHNLTRTSETIDGTSQANSQLMTSQYRLTTDKHPKTENITQTWVVNEHNYSAASRVRLPIGKNYRGKKPGFNCAQVNNMRTQLKRLRSEICRLRKNGKFKSRLANANALANTNAFQLVVQRMSKPAQLFVNMQRQAQKKPKGRRFTIEEKVLSLSLYKKSPKCYTLLHKYFTLPSKKAMKRLLSQIKLTPGINPIIFQKIKKTVAEKPTQDKLCSLAFDEMSLTPQINYNHHKDTFEGFASNNENKFADHVLVFMVKGVKQNFKQPVAYYFTNCLSKIELKKILKTVIRHVQDSGLIILNTVCDQSSVNVSAINELVNETKALHLRKGAEWRFDCFSVNGHKIIPLFDTPHLIKGIRNNLLSKDMLYTTKNKEKIVKWEYFQRVYDADKSYGELKLLHKITEEHINPDKINKMRVKTATQIFSHSVAVVTEHLTARGDLPEECRQLIDLTLLLDNLFDSLNVSTLNVPNGKCFKGAVKNNSPHHILWTESKNVLKSVKFLQKKVTGNKTRLIETTVPSVTNLIRTIEGMEAIWQVMSKKYGLDAMLTRNFNQDPVENFFGSIRSYGARNNAPNTVGFEGAYKALLLNNYSSAHSSRANCEEDFSDCLQNLDFFLKEKLTSNASSEESCDTSQERFQFNADVCIEMQSQDDAGQRNYVCGWVLTKCLKNICKSCQQCRRTLINTDTHNNAFIRAKEYCNKNWLCYPSEAAENCFREVQNITRSFLKTNVSKKNVKKTIAMFCDILLEYPFKCETHMEQLKNYFLNCSINIILYSWCRTINRILSGKITYEGEDEVKNNAVIYYNKHKHYKNKK